MKKIQLISAGLLLAGLAGFSSCDDKIPVAMPQENEQGPVLEGITGTSAAATSTMTAGIDLETLDPETTPTLTLYTLSAGDSGLEASQLSASLQISNSSAFAEYVELEPVDGAQGTVSSADLNEAYLQLFGRAPQTSTAYYRIPMYATVDGTTYRIGSYDYYGAQGTFEITAPNPDFEILEHYYLISDLNGWGATQEALAPYELVHTSSESIYDDPTFSYSFESEGSTYWKIVPGDVYDEMGQPGFEANDDTFWGLLIGVETDGDSSQEGSLVSTNAQAGMIPAGTWTITINMEEWTYTITGKAAGGEGAAWALADLFFRGSFTDDWGAYPEYEFVLTSTENTYLNPMASLPAGINFKVADSSWGTYNFGVGDGTLTFGTAYNMVYNAGDIAIPGAFNGWTEVVVAADLQSAELTMNEFASATAGTPTGIYLRGGMNDWGTGSDWEFLTTEYDGVYELAGVTISAGTEFKAADEAWGTINEGATDGVDGITLNAANTLTNNGGNLSLDADFTGTIQLVYIESYNKYFIYLIPN